MSRGGRVKIMTEKPKETSDLSLWELMASGWTVKG